MYEIIQIYKSIHDPSIAHPRYAFYETPSVKIL